MFGSMGQPLRKKKKKKKIGAGNAISCNDITFPQPKTVNAETGRKKSGCRCGERSTGGRGGREEDDTADDQRFIHSP